MGEMFFKIAPNDRRVGSGILLKTLVQELCYTAPLQKFEWNVCYSMLPTTNLRFQDGIPTCGVVWGFREIRRLVGVGCREKWNGKFPPQFHDRS